MLRAQPGYLPFVSAATLARVSDEMFSVVVVLLVLERTGNVLRVVTVDGTISTVAGNGETGDADGKGPEARINSPKHLCVDADDNVIIADEGNHLIRKYDAQTGTLTTILGVLPPDDEDGGAQRRTLETALGDPAIDVRWNAAVALARAEGLTAHAESIETRL